MQQSRYLASTEWRHLLGNSLQSALFYDLGSVSINRDPFDASANNRRTLAGAAFGLYAMFGGVDVRSSLAWRTSGGAPTSVPPGSARTPTLWLRANLSF